MLSEIDKNFSKKLITTRPQGGLFIWATLPDSCDMMDFCKKAVERKVAVVPGNAFIIDENEKTSCFRMNFSTPTDEQLIKAVKL